MTQLISWLWACNQSILRITENRGEEIISMCSSSWCELEMVTGKGVDLLDYRPRFNGRPISQMNRKSTGLRKKRNPVFGCEGRIHEAATGFRVNNIIGICKVLPGSCNNTERAR